MSGTDADDDGQAGRSRWWRGPRWKVRRFGLLGGALVALGTLLPWVVYKLDASDVGAVRETGLPPAGSVAGVGVPAGVAVLVAGLAIAVAALRTQRSGVWVGVMGIASGVVVALALPVLLDPATLKPEFAPGVSLSFRSIDPGLGLYLSLLGGLLSAGTALLLGRRSEMSRGPTS